MVAEAALELRQTTLFGQGEEVPTSPTNTNTTYGGQQAFSAPGPAMQGSRRGHVAGEGWGALAQEPGRGMKRSAEPGAGGGPKRMCL